MKGKQNTMFQLIVIQIMITSFFQIASSQEQIDWMYRICRRFDNVSTTSIYYENIDSALTALTNQSSEAKFFNTSVGTGDDRVNGLYVCRPDISLDTCKSCVNDAVEGFKEFCSIKKEAIAWYQQCTVRYSNRTISATLETEPWDWNYSGFNVSDPKLFQRIFNRTMDSIITDASSPTNIDRFAHNSTKFTVFEGFYGMAWCTPDISPSDCESCLSTASERIPGGRASVFAYVTQPSCVLRYDTAPFIFPDESTTAR